YGQSSAATGLTTGVSGTVASTSGVGVYGLAGAVSGSTIGVQAKVNSSSGTALVADNTAGGKIFIGQSSGVEKFSISGTGAVAATSFSGNGSALTNVNAATAAVATNALALGGFSASSYPRLNVSNSFTVTQAFADVNSTGVGAFNQDLFAGSGGFHVDTSGQITTPSVGTAALVDGAVTAAKLAADHLTIPALAFNNFALSVTPGQSVVSPGDHSVATPLLGWATVVLPQGDTITGFTFCGRDNDDPGQIIGSLKRRPVTGTGSTFAAPDLMAQVASGTTFFSGNMICLSTTTISSATIDNTLFAYYAEIELDGIVQAVSVTIDH
ncbi:MAG: hypothetical protein ACRDGM_09340, partial [bacterium]